MLFTFVFHTSQASISLDMLQLRKVLLSTALFIVFMTQVKEVQLKM